MIVTRDSMKHDIVFNNFAFLLDGPHKSAIRSHELPWIAAEARSRGLESFALMAENEERRRSL